MKTLLPILLIGFLGISCSKKDTSSSSVITSGGSVSDNSVFIDIYNSLATSMPELATTSTTPSSDAATTTGSQIPDAMWQDGTDSFMQLDGSSMNLNKYVKALLGEDESGGIRGQAISSFYIVCIVLEAAPKNGTSLQEGSTTVEITQEIIDREVCGPSSGLAQVFLGMSIPTEISAISNGTYYDYKIALNLETPGVLYVRNNDEAVNFFIMGDNTSGGVSDFNHHALSYNKTTQVMSYQFVESTESGDGMSFMNRVFVDSANEVVKIFRFDNYNHTTNQVASFSITAPYTTQNQFPLSVSWSGPHDAVYGGSTPLVNGNACIATGTSDFVENHTNTCTTNGSFALDSSDGSTIGAALKALNLPNTIAADYTEVLPSFTGATIISADLGL